MNVKDLFQTSLLIDQLQEELATIDDRIEDGEITDIDEEMKRITDKYSVTAEHLTELVDSVTFSIKNQKALIEVMKDTIQCAQARKKSAENALDRFKLLMIVYLGMNDIRKIKGTAHTMYTMNTKHVEFTGEANDLPDDCKKTTVEPKLKVIGEHLNKGEIIPGASIEKGTALVVR